MNPHEKTMTNHEVIFRCVVAGGLYVVAFAFFIFGVQSCATRPVPDFSLCPLCNQQVPDHE